MSKQKKYTDEQFIQAVKESNTLRQALSKLNLRGAGGNYYCAKDRIKQLNIDTSHFLGKGWAKGKKLPPKQPIENYLVEGKFSSTNTLKRRLFNEGLKHKQCENCGITEWNSQPAPLELDHINGNRYDNRLENLRILCPNCHAQTSTYRGKNKN